MGRLRKGVVRAGVAVADITPHGPVWMEGMIRAHKSTGVHDSIFARAMAVASGGRPMDCYVLVSLDLCMVASEDNRRIRKLASRATGIPADHMIVAATHTHSGPAAYGCFSAVNPKEDAYVEEMIQKVVEAITRAAASMAPATLGVESGREGTISHYRRLLADDGHVVMNWEPYPPEKITGPLGVIDPEVGVLRISPADHPRRCLALLFNHAGHPNVMSGENLLITADYPGLAERLLEARFGGTAIFINGAQGTMDIDGLKDRDWSGMERVARALADAVTAVSKRIKPSRRAAIRGLATRYALPARTISDAEMAWAQGVLNRTRGAIQALADGVGDDYKAALIAELRKKQDQAVPVEQVCVAIDDCALISFPGELFTEIGMRIKSLSPFRHTYILGLANGHVNYLPTRVAIQQGGYEPSTREVADGAEDIVVEQSLKLLRKAFALRT